MQKAAVVIGVDKTGELPVLQAAASGAEEFAQWAQQQGFDVTLLTDRNNGSVGMADIKKAIRTIVNQGTYTQILVYFAGHGILRGPDYELWLLSSAPFDSDEGVNVSGSIWQARNSGIPHVIFVSDACRSRPNTPRLAQVTGGVIFPNEPPGKPRPDVDVFYATLPGDPALEAPASEAVKDYKGIFTECLLKGLQAKVATVIESIAGETGPMQVIPSWRLKTYLAEEVPNAAEAISIKLQQMPEVRVESHPPKFFAMVPVSRGAAGPSAPLTTVVPRPGPLRQLAQTYNFSHFFGGPAERGAQIEEAAEAPAFQSQMQRVMESAARRSFETHTGFTSIGIPVARARALGTGCDVFEENGASQVRLHGQGSGSVLIQFANGNGVCLAVLEGFIGAMLVEDGRVVNVNYTPSANSARFGDYDAMREEVEKRRAFAAVAARRGYFRVERGQEDSFAGYLRELKAIDPTLGLYAAYAYAQADLQGDVRSVYRAMRREGLPVLFDVALLSGLLDKADLEARPPKIAPFCPLLTQGWALVGPYQELLAPAVQKVAAHLEPSLWTTFRPEGFEMLWNAAESGELQ